MHTLLLRLSGPLQSWGVQSRFSIRDTGLEPSKSGVVGLLCAALGRPRSAPVDDLVALRMGVRVDQQGHLTYDYHTAQDVLKAGGGIKDTEPSRRYYLTDACFLVGLSGEDWGLIQSLHAALRNPVWPLYLGRKAFVPGEPVWLEDGLKENLVLLDALKSYPWLGRDPKFRQERLRLVYEDDAGSEVRPDQPVSFAERRFAPRRVSTIFVPAPEFGGDPCTSRA
ncbi:MAG: type I-E CRISPR-associated protein Cas5/CasD [candidate division KSB1 bacterium]|nr:type I-E CRISPR-associated protein Cas5/CasD [candidate division KSB1 bacterium]